MPEAPDLEVIKDYLNQRTAGLVVCSAKVLRPTVIRSLAGDLPTDVQGRTLDEFRLQGKFLLIQLSRKYYLKIIPDTIAVTARKQLKRLAYWTAYMENS